MQIFSVSTKIAETSNNTCITTLAQKLQTNRTNKRDCSKPRSLVSLISKADEENRKAAKENLEEGKT